MPRQHIPTPTEFDAEVKAAIAQQEVDEARFATSAAIAAQRRVEAETRAVAHLKTEIAQLRTIADDIYATAASMRPSGEVTPPTTRETFEDLLSHVGRSFVRAFVGSLVVLLPGILTAPELTGAAGLGVAAVIASIAAGLRAVQALVSRFSFGEVVGKPWCDLLDSFTRAFLAALIAGLTGMLAMPDLSTVKAALTAVIVGAFAAGLRAIQGTLTPGEPPFRDAGLTLPEGRSAGRTTA